MPAASNACDTIETWHRSAREGGGIPRTTVYSRLTASTTAGPSSNPLRVSTWSFHVSAFRTYAIRVSVPSIRERMIREDSLCSEAPVVVLLLLLLIRRLRRIGLLLFWLIQSTDRSIVRPVNVLHLCRDLDHHLRVLGLRERHNTQFRWSTIVALRAPRNVADDYRPALYSAEHMGRKGMPLERTGHWQTVKEIYQRSSPAGEGNGRTA